MTSRIVVLAFLPNLSSAFRRTAVSECSCVRRDRISFVVRTRRNRSM